jgi:hypothetical protein
MAKANGKRAKANEPAVPALSRITVAGFKSIGPERSIEVRPLTLLAGANSSGKSSIMQPLLLLKQTLEAPYDPGALLLSGPNVRFTSADQMLARVGSGPVAGSFQLSLRLASGPSVKTTFRKETGSGFGIEQMTVSDTSGECSFWPKMTHKEILESGVFRIKPHLEKEIRDETRKDPWQIGRERCFLEFVRHAPGNAGFSAVVTDPLAADFVSLIADIIHLPGLRGNPERTYPVAAVGPTFPGTFEKYTASVISHWASENQANTLADLDRQMKDLVLTGGVSADRLNGVQIEIRVGRLPNLPPRRPDDRVNIADVGIGVSQVLPVVTALLAAKPGQLVYIEQPEIHLHPRAQVAMARLLADAANRGVRVVAETHSSLVLLGVQSLVAEGVLAPDKVKLHWFQRNEKTGATDITSADLDVSGAYGDWPEDFADVELAENRRYSEAAFERLRNGAHGKASPTKTGR